MAQSRTSSRAVTAGISCAVGVALPAAVFAATIPFEGAHEVVSPFVVPVAAGAVAGVGILTATSAIADARARRREEGEPAVGARFAGRRQAIPSDVPVIKRAQDALSEDEAWAEIDALFQDGSPISCDPAKSKDIYQIALDELRREATASFTVDPSAPTAATAQPAPAAADSTAVFLAAAQGSASVTIDLDEPDSLFDDVETDRLEALASLDSIDGTPVKAPEPLGARAAAGVKPLTVGQAASEAATTGSVPLKIEVTATDSGSFVVPMVDYSGHEDMWAQALAILAEPAAPEPVEEAYTPKHFRVAAAPARVQVDTKGDASASDKDATRGTRKAGRDYLSVIPGGTASFALKQAEA